VNTTTGNYVLGIDPGLNGALALYSPATHMIIDVVDMPIHTIRGKQQLDLASLADWMRGAHYGVQSAVIEEVGAMPKQGLGSTFKFGRVFGNAEMLLAAFAVPFAYVRPAVWKKAMGLTTDKDASRQMANRYFPSQCCLWERKKDDGRAEAALLAVYASKIMVMMQ